MMNELKKLYFRVKSLSGEFKKPLDVSFTGNELFEVITQFKALDLSQATDEDTKLATKLTKYLETNPVKVNVLKLDGGYVGVQTTNEPL
jgi:hypothetical protein